MADIIPLVIAGNLGTNEGANADGVLIGQLTSTDPVTVLLKTQALAGICQADDGTVFTNETTPFNEATADDVEVLPAVPAVGDACYFGHATSQFQRIDLNETTQGDGTWTIVWEYYNGSAWAALSGVTDGTTGFTAATGWVSVTYTLPTDWAKVTINTVEAYYIRARVSVYSAVVTAPQVGQGYIIGETPTWTDDQADFVSAGAGDVALLPAYPVVGDGIYIGHGEKFCKLKITISQERTGTATMVLKYWDGSAWSAITVLDDDSAGWSTGVATYLLNFAPPSDWTANTAANGPNAQTGYFIAMLMTAITDVTQQPLATQGWVLPLVTGAEGIPCRGVASSILVDMQAGTKSGTTQDSKFLLVDIVSGTNAVITWDKGDPHVRESITIALTGWQKFALVQITEDGSTEFADAQINLSI